MLLVVDVGNTQTHFGVFDDGGSEPAQHWRFASVRESTGDELGAALSNLLALRGLSLQKIDASIVSSTVPQLSEQWMLMSERYLQNRMLVVGRRSGSGCRSGWTIRTRSARTVWSTRSPRTSGCGTPASWSTSAPRSPMTSS